MALEDFDVDGAGEGLGQLASALVLALIGLAVGLILSAFYASLPFEMVPVLDPSNLLGLIIWMAIGVFLVMMFLLEYLIRIRDALV